MEQKPALVIVDVQYDFISGSLAVKNASDILPVIYDLMDDKDRWSMVIASQDYHPPRHVSFASTHGRPPFEPIRLPHPITADNAGSAEEGEKLSRTKESETIVQMLWPDHCIQGTKGSDIEEGVKKRLGLYGPRSHIVQKGDNILIDGYSAFSLNHYVRFTELARLLFSNNIQKLTIVGLATDYCVKATAIDARKFNFDVDIVRAGVRGVASDKEEEILKELQRWGCRII